MDERAAVRDVIESWAAAVRRKDIEGIVRNHSSDIMMFDVPPPFQVKGIEAYRKTWDLFFGCLQDSIRFDITDMNITAGSDVAFAVMTMQCSGTGQPDVLDFRLTTGLRKIDGQWTIVHEHHSIPAED